MAPRLKALLLLAVAVAVAVAGCGGDTRRAESEASATTVGSSASTIAGSASPSRGATPVPATPTDPARGAYVSRVDAICGRADTERSKDETRVRAVAGSRESIRAYDDTIALGWRELRQIEAVGEPPGEGAVLRANIFEPIQSQLAMRTLIRNALAAVNLPRLRHLRAELDNSSRSLSGFARGYGFQVCGAE